MNPQVGIWWDNRINIVTFSVVAGTPDPETGLCDCEYSHNDLWPEAALHLEASPDDEYYSVPRGRVKFDPLSNKYIIFHGNRTNKSRLPRIARKFGLRDWDSKTVAHYSLS